MIYEHKQCKIISRPHHPSLNILITFHSFATLISRYSVLSMCVCVCVCVCARALSHSLVSNSFETSWTVAHQALPPVEFSRQEYWSGLPFLYQGIFPTQVLNLCHLCILHWQVDSLPLCHLGSPIFEFSCGWSIML